MRQLKPIEIDLMRDKRDLFLEECINDNHNEILNLVRDLLEQAYEAGFDKARELFDVRSDEQ